MNSKLSVTRRALVGAAGPLFVKPNTAFGSQAKPKVLIIGTDHAPTCFLSAPGYTNAHLRVVLNNFKPTMIGIESNPVWMARGIVNRVTYEAQVAIDWAAAGHVPVYGLDWEKLEDLAEMNRRGLKLAQEADPPPQRVSELRDQARKLTAALKPFLDEFATHPNDFFLWLNTRASEEQGLRRAELLKQSTGPAAKYLRALDYRNARIAGQIVDLVRRYPGARLAVLMGFGHKWPLEQQLAHSPDVELVPWSATTAISTQEIEAAWRPKDSLGALREGLDGALSYFNPEGVNLNLVSEHLTRLQRAGIGTEEVTYFGARSFMVRKQYDAAEKVLLALGNSASGEGFSYRLTNGWWEFPVAFMARLELAKIEDLRRNREKALKGYAALLKDLERMTPPIPPDESFPDTEAWITDGHFAFYRVWTCQAARRALQALMNEPFGDVYGTSQAGQ